MSFTTATSGTITLTRAASGQAAEIIYNGPPFSETGESSYYLDTGDGTPGPLLSGTIYVYNLTDGNGSVSTSVTTTSRINIEQVQYTQLLIALLQGAVNSARDGNTLPNGIKWAKVMNAMPIASAAPLPSVFVNPELIQQETIPIGADVERIGDLVQPATENVWTQTEHDRHMFRITVMSTSPDERDYYRDFIMAAIRIAVASTFEQFGANISHRIMAESYQDVDQTNLMIPGFYASDILYDFTATANVKISTSYGVIETITGTISTITGDISDPTNSTEVLYQAPTL